MRIAISPCPNDIFIFGALILGKVKHPNIEFIFEYHDIEELNKLGLSDSPPDGLKFSYAHYPELSNSYRLLEVGSALGEGVGPLLIGKRGVSLDERSEILIPGEKTTAALLCKRYAPKGIPLKEMRYDKIVDALKESPHLAGVIIHESRFTYMDHGLECLIDLGGEWEAESGLPLPLGGVALLKSHSVEVRIQLTEIIRQSLEYAYQHRDELRPLMREHAREMDDEVMDQHIGLYVNEYSLGLGLEGRRAISTLLNDPDCFQV